MGWQYLNIMLLWNCFCRLFYSDKYYSVVITKDRPITTKIWIFLVIERKTNVCNSYKYMLHEVRESKYYVEHNRIAIRRMRGQWSGLSTMTSHVQSRVVTKTLGEFFLHALPLVDKVTRYLLRVGGDTYPVELVELYGSWPGH